MHSNKRRQFLRWHLSASPCAAAAAGGKVTRIMTSFTELASQRAWPALQQHACAAACSHPMPDYCTVRTMNVSALTTLQQPAFILINRICANSHHFVEEKHCRNIFTETAGLHRIVSKTTALCSKGHWTQNQQMLLFPCVGYLLPLLRLNLNHVARTFSQVISYVFFSFSII